MTARPSDASRASGGAHAHCHEPNAARAAEHGKGEAAIDPVCGMTVATDSPHHAGHAGQEYRFCSAGCRSKFVADPTRYLQSDLAADETAPAGTQYTCPMHPEIVRDAPGAWPICGMALEPMMPTLDDGPNHELMDMTRRLWVSITLTVPVLVVAMNPGRVV